MGPGTSARLLALGTVLWAPLKPVLIVAQIPWLYPPEILPLSIRSKGASLSTAANWTFNFIVGEMTPILQDWIKWRLYLVHAFFCVVSFVTGKLARPVVLSWKRSLNLDG